MKKLSLIFKSILGLLVVWTALVFSAGCNDPEPLPCDPPTNLQVIGIGPNSATITWSAPPGTTVEIAVSPQPTPPGPFTTTHSTFTLTGLSPDTDYKITLRTVCSEGVYSDPAIISFRTSTIIIVDVIVQKEAVLSDATSICSSSSSDDIDVQSPINWSNSQDEELLVITNSSLNTRVLIYKRKNLSGVYEYSAIANDLTICGSTAKNAPGTVQTITNGARLLGTNYDIELTATAATMTASNGGTVLYSMYR